MTVTTVSTFLALLALAANAGTVVAVAGGIGRRAGGGAWAKPLVQSAVPLAWLVAAVSTAGSLYFSEVAHFVPCTFCWYQRIAMYPLVVVLAVAWWRRSKDSLIIATVMAGVGIMLSTYHYIIQTFPQLTSTACSVDVPCTAKWINVFGFMSIPYMAFSGFAFILSAIFLSTSSSEVHSG